MFNGDVHVNALIWGISNASIILQTIRSCLKFVGRKHLPLNRAPHAESAQGKRGQEVDRMHDVNGDLDVAAGPEAFDVSVQAGQAA